MSAVRQDVGDVRVGVRRLLDAPIDPKDEVAKGLFGPEALVAGGLALGVVVDDAVDHLPVPAVAGRHLPAGQVLAVEEGHEPLGRLRWVVVARRQGGQHPKGGGGQSDCSPSNDSSHADPPRALGPVQAQT